MEEHDAPKIRWEFEPNVLDYGVETDGKLAKAQGSSLR